MFNFVNDSQWILTLKRNVKLGVIRVNVIANIMVSKYRTKWKQITNTISLVPELSPVAPHTTN